MSSSIIFKRLTSLLLVIVMIIAVFGMAFSAQAATPTGKPGQVGAGYVSLHQYISPTAVENVYKITMSIKGVPQPPLETRVAVVFDNSSSMDQDDDLKNWNSASIQGNYYDNSALAEWEWRYGYYLNGGGSGGPFSPYTPISSPADLTALNGAEKADARMTSSQSSTLVEDVKIGYPEFFSPGALEPGAIVEAIESIGAAQLPPLVPFFLNSLSQAPSPNAVNGATPFKTNWIAPLDGGTYSNKDTRLQAAIEGTISAVETFSSRKTNPNADITSVGVVGFASPDMAADETWLDLQLWAGFNVYGFGDDYAVGANNSSITYSTRTSASSGAFWGMMNGGTSSISANSQAMLLKGQLDSNHTLMQHMQTLEPITTIPQVGGVGATTIGDIAKLGLIPFEESGAGKNKLISDLKENIKHGTPATRTFIDDGLAEAEKILFGGPATGGADPITGYNADGIRRFVIFLSDGGDNSPGGGRYKTMQRINSMKANGVDFMVIGVDPMGGKASDGISPDQIAIPSASNANFDPQFLVWMGSELNNYKNGAYTNWPDVQADYTTTGNWNGQNPTYAYIDPKNTTPVSEQIEAVFADFVNRIIEFGRDAKAEIKISDTYDLYSMPGKPMIEIINGRGGATATRNGRTISWDLNQGVPLEEGTEIAFYVKLNADKAKSGIFYAAIENATFSCTGPFYTDGPPPNPAANGFVRDDISITMKFPTAYATLAGETKEDDKQELVSAGSAKDDKNVVYTGDSTGGFLPIMGTGVSAVRANVKPNIKGVKTGILKKSGKTSVSVTVDNTNDLYFQWQYKSNDGKWNDIFGANASTYILSTTTFVANKTYTLRCKVSNYAGKAYLSDEIKAKATKSVINSEGLSSK